MRIVSLVVAVLTPLLALASAARLRAESGWSRPYKESHRYIEYVAGYEVIAAASIEASTEPGDVAATLVTYGPRVSPNTVLPALIGPTRSWVGVSHVTQLRFIGADDNGVQIDRRSVRASDAFARCVNESAGANISFLEARIFGVQVGCEPTEGLDWESWRPMRLPTEFDYAASVDRDGRPDQVRLLIHGESKSGALLLIVPDVP